MEIGGTTRTTAPSATNVPQRADALQAAGAVKTELKPEASVQQVRAVEPVRFEPADGSLARAALDQALRDTIARRLVLEPKTREVIYQTVNRETGEILRQVPDEAMLRLRAYAREMHEKGRRSSERRVDQIA